MFVVLEIGTRSVHLLGATTNPDCRWTTQHIRNLVMNLADRATQLRFLIRDRAGQFTASCDAVLADVASAWSGFLRTARRRTVSPNGSSTPSKPKLTDRILIVNQRHLRGMLAAYIRHDNGQRPHRARELRPPQPTHPVTDLNHEQIKHRPIRGGLISEYERAA